MVTIYEDELYHEGILRKSGRYPWGSGENPQQRNRSYLAYVDDMRSKGMTDSEIAKGQGITTTQLRAASQIAKNAEKLAQQSQATRLKSTGMSNIAIGKEMGINESSVRSLLNPSLQAKADILGATAKTLKEQVDEHKYLDVGLGTEAHMGISKEKLATAVAVLQEEGYKLQYVKTQQLGTGEETRLKVLTKEDTPYMEVINNKDKIHNIGANSSDGGLTYDKIEPPLSIDSKRVAIKYGNEGGAEADGVIHVRRGVEDVSLGGAQYAQVRIAVDGSHYIKGMAMYKDDLPAGVDLMFNTNKHDTGNKLDALKPMKDDPTNPFGAVIRQKLELDEQGNVVRDSAGRAKVKSAMNIVNEEGDWDKWSKNLSSQVLSKQPVALAKEQLAKRYTEKKAEYDEIMSLTNPAVKKKLLESFADDMDSSAVHLKAASLPRQRTQVILPISSIKDTEIYAPNFRNGEKVVLVRYPHGGIFEIPELTVNNRNKEALSSLKDAKDAVAINHKVAERLSGADFDGDTVLVIPNNSRSIKTSAPLSQLKNFDPKTEYPAYEGMPKMSPKTKQQEMGNVSNLITDMTIKGATNAEIARAVKHSMVVIDAEKHNLNYKQSALDNNIAALKREYQGGARRGATTVISRSSSPIRIDERKPSRMGEGGPIDPVTGKKNYTNTNAEYINKNGETVRRTSKVSRMEATDDAYTLSSGTQMEAVYADHANRLKALANQSRKDYLNTPPQKVNVSAKAVYAPQVKRLKAALSLAQQNAPLERQAQLVAGASVKAKQQANPDMDKAELKKIKGLALTEARQRVGAKKVRIEISDDEWDAIQSGAISNNFLTQIMANTNIDHVKALATPRTTTVMTDARTARARAMMKNGVTRAEIADALGVNINTLNSSLES